MKKESIKSHLTPYSIHQKRKTTISHAFASAMAPSERYADVEAKLDAALRLLGQDPDRDLRCVYCGQPAETWDHLVGLVEKSELRGYGHQLGNLVPSCRRCNSVKGSKDWRKHLQTWVPVPSELEVRSASIQSYLELYATRVVPGRAADRLPDGWKRYCEIREKIIDLMKEADLLAIRLRGAQVSMDV